MRIVKLPPERWEDYKALRLEALSTDPEAFGATYEASLDRPDSWWRGHLEVAQQDPNKTVLFAEQDDGTLVGMAGAYPEQEAGCVDVTAMFVRPATRGKGIGNALLKAVVGEVRADKVRLCVNASLAAAPKLYERFGFVTLAETTVTRADGTTYPQLFMELRR